MSQFVGDGIYNAGGGGSIDTSIYACKSYVDDVTSFFSDGLMTNVIDVVHFKAYHYCLLNEDDNFLSSIGFRFELSAEFKTTLSANVFHEVVVMNIGVINPDRIRVPVMMYNSGNPNGQLDRDSNFFVTNYNNTNNLSQEGSIDGLVRVSGWNAGSVLVGFACSFDCLGASLV